MEDELGTPPANDGYLSGTVSPSYHSNRGSGGAWGGRTLQTHPSFKNYGQNWMDQRKIENHSPHRYGSEATAVDLISLLEENWFWRSSTASPSMAAMTSGVRLEAPRTPPRRSHRNAGVSPSRPPSSVREVGSEAATPLERGPLEREESSGSDMSDPARRKTRSADLDEASALEDSAGELSRPHSYAPGSQHPREHGGETKPEINVDAIETIGTWGHRVIRFPPDKRRSSTPTHIPGTPDEPELRSNRAGGSRGRGKAASKADTEDDTAAVNAAWKWRFNRRWRTEQAKQLDPDFGMENDDEDGWDDALGYLDACGPGVQHQIARTTSMEQNLGASSVASNVSDMSQLLVEESQKEKGGLKSEADMDATKKVRSVAKKAQNLYWKQKEIEKDVKTRWGNTLLSMSWAGQHMKTVEIDSYGKFLFVLVRVSDRTKVQRLLVRGRNSATKEDLMKDVKREAENVCQDFKLPPVTLALLGTGTLSWSRERDHRINVCSGHVERALDSNIHTGEDLCRVAGNLTRASMPAPNRVTVEGRKLS